MKRKWTAFLVIEGLLAAGLVFWLRPGDAGILAALAWPLTALGQGLRRLSLSGTAGDLAAWCVYLAVSLTPLAVLGLRLVRGKRRWEDALLPVLSGALFWGLYYLINPSLLSAIAPDTATFLIPQCILAVAVGYGVLALLRGGDPETLLRWVLYALSAVFVFAACGAELGRLLEKLNSVQEANTIGGLGLTNFFLILGYLVNAMGLMLDVWITVDAQDLLAALSVDAYSEDTLAAARGLEGRCRASLTAVVLGSLVLNLGQTVLVRFLRDVRVEASVPLGSMALILSLSLLCRLLVRGKEMRDDSELII